MYKEMETMTKLSVENLLKYELFWIQESNKSEQPVETENLK